MQFYEEIPRNRRNFTRTCLLLIQSRVKSGNFGHQIKGYVHLEAILAPYEVKK